MCCWLGCTITGSWRRAEAAASFSVTAGIAALLSVVAGAATLLVVTGAVILLSILPRWDMGLSVAGVAVLSSVTEAAAPSLVIEVGLAATSVGRAASLLESVLIPGEALEEVDLATTVS